MSLTDNAPRSAQWFSIASTDEEVARELERRLVVMQEALDQHGELLEKLTGFMSENRPTFREIMASVCEYYDVTTADILSHSHYLRVAYPRMIVYYLARRLTRLSLSGIAQRVGQRDHGTIYSGIKRISYRLHSDEILRDDIDVLRARIAERVSARPVSS